MVSNYYYTVNKLYFLCLRIVTLINPQNESKILAQARNDNFGLKVSFNYITKHTGYNNNLFILSVVLYLHV